MSIKLEIHDGEELLFGAHPDNNVQIPSDTHRLEIIEKALKEQLNYVSGFLADVRNVSGDELAQRDVVLDAATNLNRILNPQGIGVRIQTHSLEDHVSSR
ncbi:MAG: hypothetical protein BA863_03510 [Desulfovibrio sp. S3730MH75]|nr:MAG: hypothetical protein BA863_03510 [Desulfovibrio sp. S3730MH75]